MCLDAGTYSGPLTLQACDTSLGEQQWWVQSTMQSAVPGTCGTTGDLSEGVWTPPPAAIQTEPCGQSGVDYDFSYDTSGGLHSGAGYCTIPESRGYVNAEAAPSCKSGVNSQWTPLPNGEVVNLGTGLCLADPGNSDLPNNQLQVQPCDGALGEIWALG